MSLIKKDLKAIGRSWFFSTRTCWFPSICNHHFALKLSSGSPGAVLIAKRLWQAFCSCLSLHRYPASKRCGACWKPSVITWAFCAQSYLTCFITMLFQRGKRNPRYKTSVGNGQCGYWRTNDTTSHFRMKAEYRWQHLSASTMKGQQVTSQKVEWFFKRSKNISGV